MSSSPAAYPNSHRFSRASRCSITELSPTINDQGLKFIDGVVSLIWPYSSSNHRTAIFLAESDFRIRRAKGQTKVTFHGQTALAVAASHVEIGDRIRLSLEDAQWARPGEDVSTVGRRADWDVEYAGRLFMEIHRSGPPLAVVEVTHVPEAGNGPLREINLNEGMKASNLRISKNQESWSSPAFAKQNFPLSNPMIETAVTSFMDEDGYIPGKGRKRTRFTRDSGSWRYGERSSSPDEHKNGQDSAPTTIGVELDIKDTSNRSESHHEHSLDGADTVPHPTDPRPPSEVEPANGPEARPTILMPPPSFTVTQHEELGIIQPDVNIQETSTIEEDGQPAKHITPSPKEAITPRLVPLTSPGLPMISPLVKRSGYFPPMSGEQSELDSSAEIVSKPIYTEVEHGVALFASQNEVVVNESFKDESEGAKMEKSPSSAVHTIDLTSPSGAAKREQGETEGPELPPETSPRTVETRVLERHVSPCDESVLRRSSSLERQLDGQSISDDSPGHPTKGTEDIAQLEVARPITIPSINFKQTVPSSPPGNEDDSPDAVEEYAEPASPIPDLEQPTITSLNRVDNFRESYTPSEIAVMQPKDINQDGQFSSPSSAPKRPLPCVEREIDDSKNSTVPPTLSLKRRWSANARVGSIARQSSHGMQAISRNISRSKSHDGTDDAGRSLYAQRSDVMSGRDRGRPSPLCDADGNLMRQRVEIPEATPSLGQGDSETDPWDENNSLISVNDAQIAPGSEPRFDNNNVLTMAESEVVHDVTMQSETAPDVELALLTDSAKSDVDMTEEEYNHEPSLSIQAPNHAPELRRTSPTLSPSRRLQETLTTCRTPRADLQLVSHVEEHIITLGQAAETESPGHPSLRQPKEPPIRADHLVTPDNTQPEAQQTRLQDIGDGLRGAEPQRHLPPSPQNTQEQENSQSTGIGEQADAKLEQEKVLTGPGPHIEDTGLTESVTGPWSSQTTQHRRSSRLSVKMPLLGRNPSDIVSPYFTSKTSGQHTEQDDRPASPIRHSFGGNESSRPSLAVLIPPPADRRSVLGLQEPARSHPAICNTPSSRRQSRARGFTTAHSYYPSLVSLPTHFNDQVDILAVTTTSSHRPQRATSGPKDYFISVNLVDSSCKAGDTATLQLFRPYKHALPACGRGDVLLLRDVKVRTRPTLRGRGREQGHKDLHGLMLLSTESSAWAVFKFSTFGSSSRTEGPPLAGENSARSPVKHSPPSKMDVQINGPPVELGAEERAMAKGLNKWWIEEGEAVFPPVKSKPKHRLKGKGKYKLDALDVDERNLYEHELRDGMAYGDMISPKPLHEHFHRDEQTDGGGIEGALHEHELRDGMAYGDTISPKPLHDHQHDHNPHTLHDHQHDHNPHTLHNHRTYSPSYQHQHHHHAAHVNQGITLHEHELRDGMAYGDIISPKPLHEHFHQDGRRAHSQLEHEGASVVPAQHSPDAGLASTLARHDVDHHPVSPHHPRQGARHGSTGSGTISTSDPIWSSQSPEPGPGSRGRVVAATSEPGWRSDEESEKSLERRKSVG